VTLLDDKGISLAQMRAREEEMLERFKRESIPMLGTARELADWELLSIAQHQGMPTRLLDWTANALAALWFAVSKDPPDDEESGVVWVVESPNVKKLTANDRIFYPDVTYFFQPFPLDRRIVAQSAWFSVSRYDRRKNQVLELEGHERYKNLKKFIIARDHGQFKSLRQELRLLGVSDASMFPDLSGLCADIRAEFVDTW
jgi:hypothetical protein